VSVVYIVSVIGVVVHGEDCAQIGQIMPIHKLCILRTLQATEQMLYCVPVVDTRISNEGIQCHNSEQDVGLR